MRRRAGFALILGFVLLSPLCHAIESETYLGNKLRYVIERVDNTYIEKNKNDLVTRHRKALEKQGEFLAKKYPSLGSDLETWLEKDYGEAVQRIRNAQGPEKGDKVSFDMLLVLDREDPLFRRRLIAHLTDLYPTLFGDMACFLRDNYPSALREVLRMTFRMTSHVSPCALASTGEPESGDTSAAPRDKDR